VAGEKRKVTVGKKPEEVGKNFDVMEGTLGGEPFPSRGRTEEVGSDNGRWWLFLQGHYLGRGGRI